MMARNSSDQPPRFRFTVATLLIGVTAFAISFGVAGVPITIYLAGVLAALAMFFTAAKRNGLLAIFLFFLIWTATILLLAFWLLLTHLGSSL